MALSKFTEIKVTLKVNSAQSVIAWEMEVRRASVALANLSDPVAVALDVRMPEWSE